MKVSCADMAVIEVKFQRNIEFNSQQETQVSVKVETTYGVNEDPDAENSRLMLSFTVGEEENKNMPFFCKIVIAGIYNWNGASAEDAEKEIMTMGANQLMSFITSYFHDLTLKARLQPVILPPIEFDDM